MNPAQRVRNTQKEVDYFEAQANEAAAAADVLRRLAVALKEHIDGDKVEAAIAEHALTVGRRCCAQRAANMREVARDFRRYIEQGAEA